MSSPLIDHFVQFAPSYDRVNHILSFGLDVHWRARLIDEIERRPGPTDSRPLRRYAGLYAGSSTAFSRCGSDSRRLLPNDARYRALETSRFSECPPGDHLHRCAATGSCTDIFRYRDLLLRDEAPPRTGGNARKNPRVALARRTIHSLRLLPADDRSLEAISRNGRQVPSAFSRQTPQGLRPGLSQSAFFRQTFFKPHGI